MPGVLVCYNGKKPKNEGGDFCGKKAEKDQCHAHPRPEKDSIHRQRIPPRGGGGRRRYDRGQEPGAGAGKRVQDPGDPRRQRGILCIRHSGGGGIGLEKGRQSSGREECCHAPCGRTAPSHRLRSGRLFSRGHEEALFHHLPRKRHPVRCHRRLRWDDRRAGHPVPKPSATWWADSSQTSSSDRKPFTQNTPTGSVPVGVSF